jgi:hypothetical protein
LTQRIQDKFHVIFNEKIALKNDKTFLHECVLPSHVRFERRELLVEVVHEIIELLYDLRVLFALYSELTHQFRQHLFAPQVVEFHYANALNQINCDSNFSQKNLFLIVFVKLNRGFEPSSQFFYFCRQIKFFQPVGN